MSSVVREMIARVIDASTKSSSMGTIISGRGQQTLGMHCLVV